MQAASPSQGAGGPLSWPQLSRDTRACKYISLASLGKQDTQPRLVLLSVRLSIGLFLLQIEECSFLLSCLHHGQFAALAPQPPVSRCTCLSRHYRAELGCIQCLGLRVLAPIRALLLLGA